ncbi:unnamed protein product [Urochloa humidicola]
MASSTKTARLLAIISRITLVLLVVFAAIMSGSLCHGARAVGADGSTGSTGTGIIAGPPLKPIIHHGP